MAGCPTVDEFENIIVKSVRGETAQIVRVKDLARVELSQQTFANFSQVFGKPAAHMVFYTLPGANDLAVAKEVLANVEQMSKKFPAGIKYASVYNTTAFVQQAINSVYHTLFEAAILVLIVIMVFLQNFRAMLVPATTVPVTIIGAFAAMAALGFSINLMTLFALILAIGIVVDDAIIIVENASHYIEKGLTPKDAAIKAMSRADRPGDRHHPGADGGVRPRRVHAGHHRPAVPPVRLGHRRNGADQRAERADAEADAVRAVSASEEGRLPAKCLLPWLQPRLCRGRELLHRHRQLDGAPHRCDAARLYRYHRARRLALRASADRLPADRGPGLLHHRYQAAGRLRAAARPRRRRQDQ